MDIDIMGQHEGGGSLYWVTDTATLFIPPLFLLYTPLCYTHHHVIHTTMLYISCYTYHHVIHTTMLYTPLGPQCWPGPKRSIALTEIYPKNAKRFIQIAGHKTFNTISTFYFLQLMSQNSVLIKFWQVWGLRFISVKA